MDSAISSIAVISLQAKSRLLVTACCPDKDLVVLISRVGTLDKMSLWKMQGSKKWEVEVNSGETEDQEITALSWSPDGRTIVLAHYPPRLSLHSLQDGREERSLAIGVPAGSVSLPRITGVSWFPSPNKVADNAMPDIFRRGQTITGSAHSILKTQPLLDPLQDDSLPVTATDLFVFQGSGGQPRPIQRASAFPSSIASWPALPTDLLAASIQVAPGAGENRPGEELDEVDRTNVDSLLTAIDSTGHIHCFLDGSYSLGAIELGSKCVATSLIKDASKPVLFVNGETSGHDDSKFSNMLPIAVQLPLLGAKSTRHVAESCSTARELVWYAMRVVREMRKSWFGDDGSVGAKEVNKNWIRALHERQMQFGQQEATAILDLTCLLTTGRASEALADFFSVGEQLSERGLQKWETTVSEALIKLRVFSEKRVAPAFQRLHLVLEEVQGWSMLPQQYGQFEFSTEEISACLDLVARGIVIAAWLAATARRELVRFREFMSFLRYEASRGLANQPETPRHDILEVNSYLMSGLTVSTIDKWFMGPVPQFTPRELSASPPTQGLSAILDHARRMAADPSQITWPPNTHTNDLSHLDRNLDALTQALAEKCALIFDRASRAVAKKADLDPRWFTPDVNVRPASRPEWLGNDDSTGHVLVRSRMVCEDNENVTQYLAIRVPEDGMHGRQQLLCMIRSTYCLEGVSNVESKVAVAMLECGIRNEEHSAWIDVPGDFTDPFDVLDMDFFDGTQLVVVYSSWPKEGSANIGLVNYSDLGYQELDMTGHVRGPSVEDMVSDAMKQKRAGQLVSVAVPITKSRRLTVVRSGEAGLSVNGRAGRRVACVVDGGGMELEVLDMEGEMESDGETEDEEGEK